MAQEELEINIKKCLRSKEKPIKSKLISSIISNCHQNPNGSLWFWQIIIKLKDELEEKNHIVHWKLCQLVHKLLNKGPVQCIKYGNLYWPSHCLNMGKLKQSFGDEIDNYHECVLNYVKLIDRKIKFFIKYQSFIPADLQIKNQNWFNNYDSKKLFELVADIFDYLDDIIVLTQNVFSIKLKITTESIKKLRFIPLTTLLEESKILYFTLVQIMRELHLKLSSEELENQLKRFNGLFFQIKTFYDSSIELNLFEEILWIPKMTNEPPQFFSSVQNGSSPNGEMEIRFCNELKGIHAKCSSSIENEPDDSTDDSSSDEEYYNNYSKQRDYARQVTLTGQKPNEEIKTTSNDSNEHKVKPKEEPKEETKSINVIKTFTVEAQPTLETENDVKSNNSGETYSRQSTLTAEVLSPNEEINVSVPSAPPFEEILDNKEVMIKQLERKIALAEEQLATKDYEIEILRKQNLLKTLEQESNTQDQELSNTRPFSYIKNLNTIKQTTNISKKVTFNKGTTTQEEEKVLSIKRSISNPNELASILRKPSLDSDPNYSPGANRKTIPTVNDLNSTQKNLVQMHNFSRSTSSIGKRFTVTTYQNINENGEENKLENFGDLKEFWNEHGPIGCAKPT